MNTWLRKKQRKDEAKARASRPNHMYGYCRIIGCGRLARAGSSDGLDTRHCRKHAEHYQRHGDPLKGSYPASSVNRCRRAAFDWLTANADNRWVRNAIGRVEVLYRNAGPHVEAFRLRGSPPKKRASAAWARLRKEGVDPRLPVAAWLAIEMMIRDDPQPVLKPEFRRVQAAKIVHRMASGSHKRWQRERPDSRLDVTEMHIYPKSRGRVLRHIGEALEEAVELLVDHHLDEIAAYRARREADGDLTARPHPSNGVSVRKRWNSS